VSAVIKWVEEGVGPEKIIATRFDASGAVARQRPVCPYPAQAAYNGSGDINKAGQFFVRDAEAAGAHDQRDRHPAHPELAAATRSKAAEPLTLRSVLEEIGGSWRIRTADQRIKSWRP